MSDAARKEALGARINVTVPEDLRPMLEWLLRYGDENYRGNASGVVVELMRRGVEVMYAEGLKNAEPLDRAVSEGLDQVSAEAFTDMTERS